MPVISSRDTERSRFNSDQPPLFTNYESKQRRNVNREHKIRIDLRDTTLDAVMKVGEGNPGAISVCMGLTQVGGRIDPDAALGGVSNILLLDSLGIYGPNIWILYKDRCGQNLAKMIAVLRAWQLGFVSGDAVRWASEDRLDNKAEFDIDALYAKVKAELPNFDPAGIGAEKNGVSV